MNTLALLPNLAGPDMLIIFMIVLIMFGAKKLPELARGLGQAVKEFSKAKEDVNHEFNRAVTYEEPQGSHGSHGEPVSPHAAPGSSVSAVPAVGSGATSSAGSPGSTPAGASPASASNSHPHA
jgi:sec-independent protein translocase protein TatA